MQSQQCSQWPDPTVRRFRAWKSVDRRFWTTQSPSLTLWQVRSGQTISQSAADVYTQMQEVIYSRNKLGFCFVEAATGIWLHKLLWLYMIKFSCSSFFSNAQIWANKTNTVFLLPLLLPSKIWLFVCCFGRKCPRENSSPVWIMLSQPFQCVLYIICRVYQINSGREMCVP